MKVYIQLEIMLYTSVLLTLCLNYIFNSITLIRLAKIEQSQFFSTNCKLNDKLSIVQSVYF